MRQDKRQWEFNIQYSCFHKQSKDYQDYHILFHLRIWTQSILFSFDNFTLLQKCIPIKIISINCPCNMRNKEMLNQIKCKISKGFIYSLNKATGLLNDLFILKIKTASNDPNGPK